MRQPAKAVENHIHSTWFLSDSHTHEDEHASKAFWADVTDQLNKLEWDGMEWTTGLKTTIFEEWPHIPGARAEPTPADKKQ